MLFGDEPTGAFQTWLIASVIVSGISLDPDKPFQPEALELREPGRHELLIRVAATGICHTDVMTRRELDRPAKT